MLSHRNPHVKGWIQRKTPECESGVFHAGLRGRRPAARWVSIRGSSRHRGPAVFPASRSVEDFEVVLVLRHVVVEAGGLDVGVVVLARLVVDLLELFVGRV